MIENTGNQAKDSMINSGFEDIHVGTIISAQKLKEIKGLVLKGAPKRGFFCLKDSQVYVQEIENGDIKVTSVGHSPINLVFPKANSPEKDR